MKLLLKCLLCLTFTSGFFAVSHGAEGHPEGIEYITEKDVKYAEGQYFLLTSLRSGTNLTTAYVQYFTLRPVKFLDRNKPIISENRLNLDLDISKPVLYRTHFGNELKKVNKNKNKLLFILRNYKESVTRECSGLSPKQVKRVFLNKDRVFERYINNLTVYHKWNPKKRLLVYYEDLITFPLEKVKEILEFLDEPVPENITKELLYSISQQALESYHEQHIRTGGSHSKGTDLEYHSKKYTPEELREIDKHIKKKYPVLWKRYLKRFETR